VSDSSSDERTRSSTPQNNNIEVGTKDGAKNVNGKRELGREESPDSESQGWASNKLQKVSPSSAVDQSTTEATMRKARVSVRARSEAPMVRIILYIQLYFISLLINYKPLKPAMTSSSLL